MKHYSHKKILPAKCCIYIVHRATRSPTKMVCQAEHMATVQSVNNRPQFAHSTVHSPHFVQGSVQSALHLPSRVHSYCTHIVHIFY